MARRSENTGAVSVYKGRFFRNIGKVINETGTLVQKKFLLGTDKAKAEIANRLIEKLWDSVVEEHKAAERLIVQMHGRLGDTNLLTGVVDYQKMRQVDYGPIWRPESLAIGEAIRKGERQIAVEVGDDARRPDKYVERISNLRAQYDVIVFVSAASEVYAVGQTELADDAQQIAKHSAAEIQRLSTLSQAPLPVISGQTLYEALEAYARFALLKNSKAHGEHEAACARRLKKSHPDIQLSAFGISAMEAIAGYWAARPLTKNTGKPVALSTVTNHLKTSRRFIKWLHRTDAFTWTKPVDAEDAFRVRIAGLRSKEEIAALGDGVAVWNIAELSTLYRYATDRERLIILLGLNCAFAQAEMCTLRLNEIVPGDGETVIKRVRHKSQVYGEFSLWPETMAGINWFIKFARGKPIRDSQVNENAKDYLLVTQRGGCFDRPRLSNNWNKLLDRVQVDHPKFRRLPFKCLRKTAGQFVRERSDGEVAGVFLCHGQAVRTDSLADVYTNRPFKKVAAALRLIHRDLQAIFDAAPIAFTERPGSSPNITVKTIEHIRQLASTGISQTQIIKETGLTAQTIRRWAKTHKVPN